MKFLTIFIFFLTTLFILTGCPFPEENSITGCMNPQASNFDSNATIADNCLCKYDGINLNCGIVSPNTIVIPPVQQQTEVWCWLAVGEMVFKYYGLPTVNPFGDYQCGIVGAIGYSMNGTCDACNVNCVNCVRPAGTNAMFSYMLTNYPKVACKNLFANNKTLNNSFVANYLSASFLINQLNQNKPVIAGINPGLQFVLPGNSQHVALIKGYFYDRSNNLILLVNDPFPYWTKGVDPYIMSGAFSNGDLSYQIPFTNFVNGLKWNTSWYNLGW
jgi:hypothetical protein